MGDRSSRHLTLAYQSVLTLKDLHLGCRLLYRSRENWRTAAIARMGNEFATLTVCSPKGRTYRLKRAIDAPVSVEGALLILQAESHPDEHWKENFGNYDSRW